MRRCLNILLLSLPCAALAASNPEVVLPECDQRTVAESCGGVTPPVPGEVFAVAGCTNFAFRIEDPLPGRERIDRREVWYGGANCPEPKDLEPRYRDLAPEISWSVVSGGVTNRGAGAVVSVPRADGVCRASCTFELTVSPSLCPPPAPVTVTAEAVFADAVSLRERETTRLCCLSSDHAPHLFDLDGCDAPVLSVVPADAATVVSLDGRTAHVKGLRPFEDAQAVATAACGAATNLFAQSGGVCPRHFGALYLFTKWTIHNWAKIFGPDVPYLLTPYIRRFKGIEIDPWPSGGARLFPDSFRDIDLPTYWK